MSGAYFNENDTEKAAWLRELIKRGVIAPGDVDERSIVDVQPDDLRGYIQWHLFAGIGVWSYAFRLAGIRDDESALSISCPCPSFSCAGQGRGFDDPRHLWPHGIRLISKLRPPELFGEQADDAIGYGWLDLVQTDLEAEDYAVGKAVLGAASVGAPHIRQRLYFGAHTADLGYDRRRAGEAGAGVSATEWRGGECQPERLRDACGCSDATGPRCDHARQHGSGPPLLPTRSEQCSNAIGSDHAERARLEGHRGDVREWRGPGWLDPLTARSVAETGATRGFWADCDWWYGKDGKYRPIGEGISPLVSGTTKSSLLTMANGVASYLGLVRDLVQTEPEVGEARVMRLRGYGDAINPYVAAEFIKSFREAKHVCTV